MALVLTSSSINMWSPCLWSLQLRPPQQDLCCPNHAVRRARGIPRGLKRVLAFSKELG